MNSSFENNIMKIAQDWAQAVCPGPKSSESRNGLLLPLCTRLGGRGEAAVFGAD